MDSTKRIRDTYSLIKNLSTINGVDVGEDLLDRMMFSLEKLPPLGKEYWWFLFFGYEGERPVQITLLIFRKYGKKMLFNNEEMRLNQITEDGVLGVTSGWIYDGDKLEMFGDSNAIVNVEEGNITSDLSGHKMEFSGAFPNYEMSLGGLINLKMQRGNFVEGKDGYGVYLFPLGMGWVDAFCEASGVVLGREFRGTAHLQKVAGVAPFGPFHWARVVFKNHTVFSFFTLKGGKNSKTFFHKSIKFFDAVNNLTIRLNNPNLKVSKEGNDWIVEGDEGDKYVKAVLEVYAQNRYDMKGGGSQVYIQYAIVPKELTVRDGNTEYTLNDIGEGVGTLEGAYW